MNIKGHLIIFIIILFLKLYPVSCLAQDKMRGPLNHSPKKQYEEYGKGKNIFLNFYQKWLSPVKGGNKCPMHPSCSQYAKISFQILPWYKAYPKSLERILHCGKELYLYPTIQIDGIIRWYDPVLTQELKNDYKIPTTNF